MKRQLTTLCLIAGIVASVSCQKELTENGGNAGAVKMVTKTMVAEGNEWLPDTRTEYQPGTGIVWSGDETMHIFYGNPANVESTTSANKYMQGDVTATPLGGGRYSFSHPEIKGITEYDYCVLTPALPTTGINGSGQAASFKFSPVQTPGQNTFDPNYDVLFGQGAKNVEKSEELEVTNFKRIFTPMKVELRDAAGVAADGKIYAATVSFSKEATTGDNPSCLAGLFYLNFGYDYDECVVNNGTATTNTVSAVYASGLEKQGDNYPVWFMVYPTLFEAGGTATFTVVTGTKTITRTVTLAEPVDIEANAFNTVGVDISGEGYSETESIYQDFTTLESPSSSLVASDGNSYIWGFSGCIAWDGGNSTGIMPRALRLTGGSGSVTLPYISGKQITRIRLYAHSNNSQSGNNKNEVSLNGGTPIDFGSYSANSETGNSGVLEIEVPENLYGQTLVISSTGSNNTAISGIALELADAEMEDANENDYYDMFTKGYDIVIDGVAYNKESYAGRVVKATELANSDFQSDATLANEGIVFIDPDGQTEPAAINTTAPGDSEKIIVIGRYKDRQPQVTLVYTIRTETVLKNLHLISTVGDPAAATIPYLTRTNTANADPYYGSITFEDCTIDMTAVGVNAKGERFESRYVAYDSANDDTFEYVHINNCLIEFNSEATGNPSVFAYTTSKNKTLFGPTDISMTNSVVYAGNTIQAYIINMGSGSSNTKFNTYNSDLNVSGNTFYNIWQKNTLVRGNVFKNFVVEGNVASFGNPASATIDNHSRLACAYTSVSGTASISNNYLYENYDLGNWEWQVVHSNSAGAAAGEGNVVNPAESPYASENTATGYFPVNTSVVTNGAGADYDTKYWVEK